MNKIVLYCKSYLPDLHRVKDLLKSINQHNVDNIPFYISVPSHDVEHFKRELGDSNYTLIKDEDIDSLNQGWKGQQIVKSQFWKLGLCENYVCIDSDCVFIKDFKVSDFMFDDNTPYTVMHEQKELFSWSVTKIKELGFDPKEGFINDRQKIMNLFRRNSRHYDFGPSPIIWSSKVWKSLEEKYMIPNNLSFPDLIEYSPSEFSWYGEALLAFKAIDIYPVEPLFKVFHYPQQYIEYRQQNITEEMISQNYMGIIMQSNFNGPIKY
jgi:hypothetical protein